MTAAIESTVTAIDSLIRQHRWFDFHVLRYEGGTLIVAGSENLTYYHTLEVMFEDVFFVSGFFNGWRSDTSATVFSLPDNEPELNGQLEIEPGYQLFVFKTEEYRNNFTVAAKAVSYNTDTVFYYDRQDLKENERLAGFVKNRATKASENCIKKPRQ